MGQPLKFKVGGPIHLNEDYWYMLTDGGWIAPENMLEQEDAAKVQAAIDVLQDYKDQGIKQKIFIDEESEEDEDESDED